MDTSANESLHKIADPLCVINRVLQLETRRLFANLLACLNRRCIVCSFILINNRILSLILPHAMTTKPSNTTCKNKELKLNKASTTMTTCYNNAVME